ncbi:MAG: hypothetical protein ACI4MM_11470 [Candidatus Ventricola sp.]
MKESIRLTNKTAVALRRNAQWVRTMYFAAAVILSLVLGVLGVFLGMMWLPAVLIMIVVIVLMDFVLVTASRSRYLSLLGQAICTEAAARDIRAGKKESRRREQAINDLMRVKADVQQMDIMKNEARPFPAEKNGEKQAEMDAGAPHRRRKQMNLQLIRD